MDERLTKTTGFGVLLLLIGFFFSIIPISNAGTLMQSSSGVVIRHLGIPTLLMAGTPTNQSGLSQADVFGLIANSLNRWRQGSSNLIQFDYWQGQYQANLDYNQESSIFFTSQTGGAVRLGSSVLAVTQVWHYVDTGEIIESDIALNDTDFIFTSNPTDSTLTTGRYVYLGNVLTHELGHALGLSHSANIQSTMLFLEALQQAKLSCDDIQTIHTAYGIRNSSFGQIQGKVLGPSGSPLVGVQVSAISINRGTVLGSALSNKSGTFTIGALEPGEYRIVAEPYYAGASPLPDYYDTVSGTICSGGRFFARTFKNQSLIVASGSTTNSGDFSVQCASSGEGTPISAIAGGTTLQNAIPLNSFLLDAVSTSATTRKFYDLGVIEGAQQFNVIQYGLYSPIVTSLRLVDSSGREVGAEFVKSIQPAFLGNSGIKNADSYLKTSSALPPDQYFLEITARLNTSDIYPAEFLALDSVGFFAITRSATPSNQWDTTDFAANSRCESVDNFDTYQSPPGTPRSTAQRAKITEPSSKFCASINSDSPPGPTPPGAVFSWFLPFFVITVSHFLRKRSVPLN